MAAYATTVLPKRYHQALVDWQRTHFKDYDYLIEHWNEYYRQAPFELVAKVGKSPDHIEIGRRKGKEKFTKAHQMKGNMFYQSAAIIKAQASTEFGSIQQHRDTLDRAIDDETRFDVIRIMAEELRHGYQMAWVMAADDWSIGGTDLAKEMIEELLAMEMGTHVLDSFNIPFHCFLDNLIYASVIDRVGKYQLTMQQVFAYKPMAQSMGPMLQEESFHMATGVNPLKKIAAMAADEKGDFSIEDVQRHFNKWFARGLEMFGSEEGGTSNVDYGFKSMKNGEAQALYIQEVQDVVVDPINAAILKVRKQGQVDAKMAKEIADRVLINREAEPGIAPEELVHLPNPRYFRRRGVHAFSLVSPRGEDVKTVEDYERVLSQTLPPSYLETHDFQDYIVKLRAHHAGLAMPGEQGGFRM